MIAVDTSALMAIIQREPDAERCEAALAGETERVISAGTVAEALIVARRRNVGEEMRRLMEGLDFEILPVTAATAHRIEAAYERWGRGIHPAGLNFGDCFAYEAAKQNGCPLLFVGEDFVKTDLERAR
ncbi:MAG TPA: type II toxin-antitoxin system VapC family toxin [Stellaceae bacterium]|nr:type II toxin-antitoxin system VapC family toxin [Stellaceae bacterium]